jgi:4-amino-4-deoxy-L-arabinose transferase-like glycosyltransferase
VLAKGPVGIAFFVVIVIAFAIWTPSMRTNLKAPRGWLGGFVLMVLVIATWYGPAYAQNGQLFVEKFLVEQNLRRFQGGDEAHTVKGVAGLLYYVPIFLLGFAPWWFWLLRRPLKPLVPLERYLVVWAATVFIFFTISGSKLPHYIVPMLAPCALLVAYRLARQWDSEEGLTPRQLLVPGLLCVGISVVAQAGFQLYYHQFHAEIHALGRFTLSQVQTTESIATYRMSRQSKDKGTGRPEIQETSHPSLVFYLNRVLADPKDLQEVSRNSGPTWILTRKDRIQPIDVLRMSREGRVLRAVQPPFPLRHYALWKLEATPSAP